MRAGQEERQDLIDAPIGATLRIGDGAKWATTVMRQGMQCSAAWFGADLSGMAYGKWCEVQVTAPSVTQIDGAMPVVNTALIPKPSIAFSGPRVITLNANQLTQSVYTPVSFGVGGAFRVPCPYSHISNDDPIVYPGKPGAAHLHTFAGNSLADASSTTESLNATGGSTCSGGTLNRTAYWFPTMIDTRTGQPIVPVGTNFYYKTGYQGIEGANITKIVPFPKGLRMIAGNPARTGPDGSFPTGGFHCYGGPNNQNVNNGDHIGNCDVGAQLWQSVDFPQCWDGVNLDSPDHKSHMAYGVGTVYPDGSPRPNVNGCPTTHPVPLPAITLIAQYLVTEPGIAGFWKLSSDNYKGTGGYSLHADWFGAWDDATMKAWVTKCLNAGFDCHDNLLGDGRTLN
ncbi:MAG TPA: DUF1996 domain-containing protein [Burkholderiaceae bacterium]|nr:DUF1996 domain-containing protein [Burkholderiaceae bacterium]